MQANYTRDNSEVAWYAMSSPGKLPYAMAMLSRKGHFCWAPFRNASEVDRSLMPLILFRATEQQVYDIFCDPMLPGYIYPKLGADIWTPCRIDDMEVRRFKTIRDLDTGSYRYFADAKQIIERGKPVRVIDGMFRGMEGYMCRIKGNTSLYVHIPNICVVSIAYIPKSCLEGFEGLKEKQERESKEQREREKLILSISDRFNRMPFAGHSPQEYLSAYRMERLPENDCEAFSKALQELRATCQQHSIAPKDLYLSFNPTLWEEAITHGTRTPW